MRHIRATMSALALASFTLVGGSAFAQDATAAAAAAPAAPAAPPITINGVIEANYTINLNKPATHENLNYYFNRKESQFALNLAEILISKAATPESRAGFTVKLIEGEVKRYNFITEDADSSNILEAYGTFLAPLKGGKDLKVDVGQFETHVGYETVEIGSNNFFSHNYLFGIPAPFYDAGVRVSYPASTKLTLNGYLYNRYNGRTDAGNRDLAPGFQLAYTLSPTSSLVFNGLTSRENLATAAAPLNRQQSVLDLIYSGQVTTTTKLAFEGLYRFGKDATAGGDGKDYNFAGIAGYGIFGLKGGNIGLRAEYMADTKNTFILGANDPNDGDKKTNLGSVTLSYEPKASLFPGLRTILEYRYDFANTKVFPKESGSNPSKNQSTITLGQIYSF